MPIDARVDLHGMTQGEAHGLLLSFLHRAHAGGLRYVLVITGKGASFGSEGVLKRAVPAWLSTPPFRPLVGSHDACRAPAWRRRRHLHKAAAAQRGAPAMTPFGERLRELRRAKGVSQKQMAASLGVSAAYLSALEHGRRGVPSWAMVQKIIGYFNVIWDDAEELQRLAETSDPRVVIDTAGLSAKATALANLLAARIATLEDDEIARLTAILDRSIKRLRTDRPLL